MSNRDFDKVACSPSTERSGGGGGRRGSNSDGRRNSRGGMKQVSIVRRACFSACHRLHSDQLSDAENKDVFGKCNSANGHGHNYVLYVTVRGEVNPITGMVMNLVDVKHAINETVMKELDHKCIDKDVAYFCDNGVVSTAENIAIYIYDSLLPYVPEGCSLEEIRLEETENNIAIYRG
eukprot:TRINITY_DN619_c0_g1_i4.p1 TRINITY_DN619_c0_g1~~TRINITY_DN619_c0_g1_i4.p1  ORF type:complete len:178 (-),score=52.14 TRINITY_DN619_c0_g1_i4:78-611(-)